MTRTVPSGLAAKKAAGVTTSAICLRLDLVDGSALGITTHDTDLTVDLGDGSLSYQAATGVLPSAVSLSIGLDADSFEARGPIGTVVTRADVLGKRYDRGRARLFEVDFLALADVMPIMAGKVAGSSVQAGQFVFEVRSATDAFNQTIGRSLSPYCSHDFGVGQCQAIPQTWDLAVASVTDEMVFAVSGSGPSAELAQSGLCTFTTGALAGLPPVEVASLAAGVLTLFLPLAEAPQVGDAFTLTEGCDKLRDTCKVKGQILNFGGFPDMIGTDAYVKFPIPAA